MLAWGGGAGSSVFAVTEANMLRVEPFVNTCRRNMYAHARAEEPHADPSATTLLPGGS